MQIGMTLNADDFAARVVPALSKLFASNDRTIRRSLLESIDSYGRHLSTVCMLLRLSSPVSSHILLAPSAAACWTALRPPAAA